MPAYYYNPNYLAHYGIPHMHWGERRYQNYDGTYTEEGKKRYGRMTPEQEAVVQIGASIVGRAVIQNIRARKAKKEVEKSGVNKDSERITEKDIKNKMSRLCKRDRKDLINRMLKNPEMTFKESYNKTAAKRVLKQLSVVALVAVTPTLIRTAQKATKTPGFMNFMKKVRNRTMKDSIVLKDSDYSISSDAPGLPEPRKH